MPCFIEFGLRLTLILIYPSDRVVRDRYGLKDPESPEAPDIHGKNLATAEQLLS